MEQKVKKQPQKMKKNINQIKVNNIKVNKIKEKINEYKKELENKKYPVNISLELFEDYEFFITQKAIWKGKEVLGLKKILERIEKCKTEGIKESICYFSNLEIEASHYFLTRIEGKGIEEIRNLDKLLNVFDEALALVYKDNLKLKDLEKELVAAEQGIELE